MSSEPVRADDSNRARGQKATKSRDQGGDQSSSKGQQGSKRFVYSTWPDTQDRDLCMYAPVTQAERTPISARTGIAVATWTVVDRHDDRILICNRLHEGECAWPWDIQTD